MGTFTAATAIATGGLITSSWMSNTVNGVNFLAAAGGATVAKDLCLMRQTTNQTSIASGTYTALTFTGTDDFDAANGHDPAVNPSRYTAKAAGKYRIQAAIYMAAGGTNATQNIVFRLYKNGVAQSAHTYSTPCATASLAGHYETPAFFISLNANDYVELYVQPDWTAATASATVNSWMSVEWVGAS